MNGTLHVTEAGPGVRLVEIDHAPANTLDSHMLTALSGTLNDIGNDETVRAIVIFGRHGAFCSGADLKEAAQDADQPEQPSRFSAHRFIEILDRLDDCRPVVIAAIDGHCIGGGVELALCCDIRLASTRAMFVCAGVNMGLMVSAYRLPRLIGMGRAKAMLLSGLPHSADIAQAWGLVTALHDPDALLPEALRLAARIASRAPLAIEATKRIAERAFDMAPQTAREQQVMEMSLLIESRDHQEAVVAFREKRSPRFTRS